MKVTKDMLHKDLQHLYGRMNLMAKTSRYQFLVKTVGALLRRSAGNNIEGIDCDQVYVPSSDDSYQIRTRVYRPENHDGKQKLPLLFYIHGGGYITGVPELSHYFIKKFIQHRPCIIVAPDYRKALEQPFPAGFNDCYDTLLWAKNNAESLGVYANRVMIAGHSAGGGLTAAVTLKARDTQDVDIAFQMPIYPMLDDQQPYDPERQIASPCWDTKSNQFGWEAYLADLLEKGEEIPPYAAPTRNSDYSNFPPTITFVGDLEPFYWETESYVKALKDQGIEVAYKAYEGCFHAFDIIALETNIAKEAINFTYDHFDDFYDRFVAAQLN